MTAAHYADVYKRFATFLRPMGDTRAFRVATTSKSVVALELK